MKKLIQVSIVLVLAISLIFGLLQVADGSSPAGSGGNPCRVGWNSRNPSCLVGTTWYKNPGIQPYVGWNS